MQSEQKLFLNDISVVSDNSVQLLNENSAPVCVMLKTIIY